MTDVKFMDLSENDSPATTDSVLIGNSKDGLKRTSIGAIGNLFAVKGLFHFEKLTVHTVPDPKAATSPISHIIKGVTAPDVPGYTFAFWLSSATYGDVFSNYVEDPTKKVTNIWVNITNGKTDAVYVLVTAVYVKSTVA